jgi:hypothetical protein
VRALAILAALAACSPPVSYPIDGTSKLYTASHGVIVTHPPTQVARLVIEKMTARGFTLVDSTRTKTGLRLKLAGNRDFTSNGNTIGSVFYAWVDEASLGISLVSIVGKPTYDHRESCPQIDVRVDDIDRGVPCTTIHVPWLWAMSGWEEGEVIDGVLAELQLDLYSQIGFTDHSVRFCRLLPETCRIR